MNLHFDYPWIFFGLIPLLPLLFWKWRSSNNTTMHFSHVDHLKMLPFSLKRIFRGIPHFFRILALISLFIACARPQIHENFSESTVEGIDIFLALDMSGSMMAVDMDEREIRSHQLRTGQEPSNRFDNAVETLKHFIAQRERDRIGMVVFAHDAFLQFPLTLDYSTILGLVDELELNAIDASATAIGNALGLSVRGLIESEARSRVVILITDGKQQGGNISPAQAAALAEQEGIQIFPILVGRDGATMIPTRRSRRGSGIIYSAQNYPVDPELLNQIAITTGGSFFRAENPEDLKDNLNQILDGLETTSLRDVASVRKTELFFFFTGFSLFMLVGEALFAFVLIRRFPS